MKKPLVFYAVAMLLGAFSMLFMFEKFYVWLIILAMSFVILKLTLDKVYFIFFILFFLLGSLSYYKYFNFEIDNRTILRVVESCNGKIVGVNKGRKMNLKGDNIKKLEVGDKACVKGRYIKEYDFKRGITGNYEIDNIKIYKDTVSKIYNIKNLYYTEIASYDENLASIVMAISLADKTYLNHFKKENMNKLGIIHILTVSGFHIALIYKIAYKLVGYKLALIITFIYISILGYTPSTVRAFIMIILLVISKRCWRNYDAISSLSLAFIVLIAVRPYYILDAGFNLSFLAVLGIFLMYDKFNEVLDFLPTILKSSVCITLSASTFTTLYIAFNFKLINLNGIISNFLLMPLYSVLIVASNILLFLVYIPKINMIFIYFLKGLILCINTFEEFLASNLSAAYRIEYIGAVTILSIYCAYIFYKKGYKNSKYVPISMIIITVVSGFSLYPKINYIKGLKSTIINVSYNNRNILISDKNIKLSKIKEPVRVDMIYDNIKGERIIKLDNKYKLKSINNGDGLDLLITYKEKNTLIVNENKKFRYVKNNLDDIKINKKNKRNRVGTFYKKYKVINGNVIEIHY